MLKHSFIVGLNDKNTLKQELSTDTAIQIIHDIVGDCTIKGGQIGIFTHADGTQVKENSLTVEKFGGTKKQALEIARQLCRKLNQESVILDTQRARGEFIGAD